MADIAYTFKFQFSEMMAMDAEELMAWHRQIDRINRLVNGR